MSKELPDGGIARGLRGVALLDTKNIGLCRKEIINEDDPY